ncbi:hypothetical protein TSUD_145930 [Trifolium subterraneum]|uniref:RNase H type-1 domain-containing protein n=1 Tax=Trifolium subterraneum TaxID=3900 RepID=A0A2Z6N078_TRISU|nr:hypothetical protein TSUD_145930 [Trifolium subterraneum]
MIGRWANSAPYRFHCTDTEETIMHVLRDCKSAAIVWNHLLPIEARHLFFVGDFKDWVILNLTTTGWRLEQLERKNVVAHIRWTCPQQGYLCLNNDGAVKKGNQQAGCGGVVRDNSGKWVCGFAKVLGSCSAYVAELWGIYEEIKIANDRNLMRIEIQVDSKATLQCFTSSKTGNIRGRKLVRIIREVIDQGMKVQFNHVYKKANKVADWLTNVGCKLVNGSIMFELPPQELLSLIDEDVKRVSTPI